MLLTSTMIPIYIKKNFEDVKEYETWYQNEQKKESVDNRGVGQTDGGNQLMLIKIPCILWVGFNFSLKNNAFCGSILRAKVMPQQ